MTDILNSINKITYPNDWITIIKAINSSLIEKLKSIYNGNFKLYQNDKYDDQDEVYDSYYNYNNGNNVDNQKSVTFSSKFSSKLFMKLEMELIRLDYYLQVSKKQSLPKIFLSKGCSEILKSSEDARFKLLKILKDIWIDITANDDEPEILNEDEVLSHSSHDDYASNIQPATPPGTPPYLLKQQNQNPNQNQNFDENISNKNDELFVLIKPVLINLVPSLQQYCEDLTILSKKISDGVALCELVVSLETPSEKTGIDSRSSQFIKKTKNETKLHISGMDHFPKTRAARSLNVNLALKKLQKWRKMNPRHLWKSESIVNSDETIICEILYDILCCRASFHLKTGLNQPLPISISPWNASKANDKKSSPSPPPPPPPSQSKYIALHEEKKYEIEMYVDDNRNSHLPTSQRKIINIENNSTQIIKNEKLFNDGYDIVSTAPQDIARFLRDNPTPVQIFPRLSPIQEGQVRHWLRHQIKFSLVHYPSGNEGTPNTLDDPIRNGYILLVVGFNILRVVDQQLFVKYFPDDDKSSFPFQINENQSVNTISQARDRIRKALSIMRALSLRLKESSSLVASLIAKVNPEHILRGDLIKFWGILRIMMIAYPSFSLNLPGTASNTKKILGLEKGIIYWLCDHQIISIPYAQETIFYLDHPSIVRQLRNGAIFIELVLRIRNGKLLPGTVKLPQSRTSAIYTIKRCLQFLLSYQNKNDDDYEYFQHIENEFITDNRFENDAELIHDGDMSKSLEILLEIRSALANNQDHHHHHQQQQQQLHYNQLQIHQESIFDDQGFIPPPPSISHNDHTYYYRENDDNNNNETNYSISNYFQQKLEQQHQDEQQELPRISYFSKHDNNKSNGIKKSSSRRNSFSNSNNIDRRIPIA